MEKISPFCVRFRLALGILTITALFWDLKFQFFTVQSNALVGIWLLLSAIFGNSEKVQNSLTGFVRGGITVYICITCLVYAIVLNPGGGFNWPSIVEHYITPILFVIDWYLTETKSKQYQWKYAVWWIVYPIGYMGVTLIRGYITNFYPYFFMDLPVLGFMGFLKWFCILISLFLFIGLILVAINRKIYSKQNQPQ